MLPVVIKQSHKGHKVKALIEKLFCLWLRTTTHRLEGLLFMLAAHHYNATDSPSYYLASYSS